MGIGDMYICNSIWYQCSTALLCIILSDYWLLISVILIIYNTLITGIRVLYPRYFSFVGKKKKRFFLFPFF